MNAPVSADRRGEGFAFFHWATAGIPELRCIPPQVGWGCLLCRSEWSALRWRVKS